MKLPTALRPILTAAAILLILAGLCIVVLRPMFSRTREFRAQAELGQPIVRAIDEFRRDSGSYPSSLTNLVPKYLPADAGTPGVPQRKFSGWDYRVVTNGAAVSYTLRYYLGRGGVEYEPPVWFGNDEGHRTILLRDD